MTSSLWKEGGGLEKVEERHCLCEAVIQTAGDRKYLFLNNLYLRAVEAVLCFRDGNVASLMDVLTGQRYSSRNQKHITVDVDRKSCRVFMIEHANVDSQQVL